MNAPDFIVPPPGLIPEAAPTDEPDRTVRDVPPRVLPAFPPPPGVATPSHPSPAPPEHPEPVEAPPEGVTAPPPPAATERHEVPEQQAADRAWRLRAPDGLEVLILRPTVLGRDPTSDTAPPGAVAIPLQDPARSVSKTHALVEVVDDGVVVTDLYSTNGTRVLTPEGDAHELEPGRATEAPNGATVLLGEFAVRLDRVPRDSV